MFFLPILPLNCTEMSQPGVKKLLIAEDKASFQKVIRSVAVGLVGEIRDCPGGM